MSELWMAVIAIGTLIVGVVLFMAAMNYAINNHIPIGSATSGFPRGSLSTKEAEDDAAWRYKQWVKKAWLAFGITMAIGMPFALLAEWLSN